MGRDHIGFKAWEVKFIETSKNKHDIDAMVGHSWVIQ